MVSFWKNKKEEERQKEIKKIIDPQYECVVGDYCIFYSQSPGAYANTYVVNIGNILEIDDEEIQLEGYTTGYISLYAKVESIMYRLSDGCYDSQRVPQPSWTLEDNKHVYLVPLRHCQALKRIPKVGEITQYWDLVNKNPKTWCPKRDFLKFKKLYKLRRND